ncbi:hypothetical protein CHCC20372_3338 [Bacillus paralicheniformis]|uniref:Uncharacterized protein n=1 Tax=Bacillus paralicheniformis TaxID=1648923 RepID=A0A7Z0X0I8_9BACI|nr:hypothetical protein B4121_0951 [Bacillus paralicheniformis]TWK22931.1 hypothetical protein CHCC20372_3338 [Bacillus paralicheniformis]
MTLTTEQIFNWPALAGFFFMLLHFVFHPPSSLSVNRKMLV